MFWIRRTAALGVVFCALPLCAFDFSYGPYFRVSGISQTEDGIKLPVARKKYANLKMLSSAVYRTLAACKQDCSQEVSHMQFNIGDWRKAKTREGMLIADVEFNNQWAVTFLVFKNKKGFGVKPPEHFAFTDKKLEQEVQAALSALAEENL